MLITPKTKVGELLDTFPQLESVLVEISPAFEKLKNPILRKTIGKVATLQQAAAIGNLRVDELVNRLRDALGLQVREVSNEEIYYLTIEPPDWFDGSMIVERFDASELIISGGSPMSKVLGIVKKLNGNEIFELRTPFVPAPLLDMLKKQGFLLFSINKDDAVLSYAKLK